MQSQQQCSVINLLPHIEQDEELLGLIINTDPELVIRYHPQTPQALIRRLPTLLIAAADYANPQLLSYCCAAVPNTLPSIILQRRHSSRLINGMGTRLQECVHTLCDWGITLGPNQRGPLILPSCLLQVLSHGNIC